MEYTLEDAFDSLVERQRKIEDTIEDLIDKISNNEVFTVNTPEEVRIKQNKLHESLCKKIRQVEPEDYPILRTSDLRSEVIIELEAEIHDMQKLYNKLQEKLSDIQEDIVYLRNKKDGLSKMQKVYLEDATETFAKKTYKKEYNLIKYLFHRAKKDLKTVVGIIFPNNDDFNRLLEMLTSAYVKGGDDVYVDVTSVALRYVNILLEADIIQYHPNNKTKIRIIELL
ncbi:PREDICTED: uncharacterized protein LOC108775633 [Cyphomyrmex costatus]|uniref:Uncharacterized protein n=1 Tax=Cyphomyrmex costatus TaxID=456900 RepID=A0A195CJ62_9HYME|nr:PREDICTED: uncharacterized protein LOC108775633 [Cyphomyrmex costatus]KYN00765.1 hypothetical protein ALC62_08448 [Cyphomyrmex costatus]